MLNGLIGLNFILLLSIICVGCENPMVEQPPLPDPGRPHEMVAEEKPSSIISTKLRPQEIAHLKLLWEKEKLARDVYLMLDNRYDSKVFIDTSHSVQAHMNSIRDILAEVGEELPVDEAKVGEFKNKKVKSLYADFMYRAEHSERDAYLVAYDIQKKDVQSLTARIDETNDPGVKKALTNLLNASSKHKTAFKMRL